MQVMKPVIRDIVTSPALFRHVATLTEPMSIDSAGDEYLIFEVILDPAQEPEGQSDYLSP
jgi:hypothetical protein